VVFSNYIRKTISKRRKLENNGGLSHAEEAGEVAMLGEGETHTGQHQGVENVSSAIVLIVDDVVGLVLTPLPGKLPEP
jgi:hypothetical protein